MIDLMTDIFDGKFGVVGLAKWIFKILFLSNKTVMIPMSSMRPCPHPLVAVNPSFAPGKTDSSILRRLIISDALTLNTLNLNSFKHIVIERIVGN